MLILPIIAMTILHLGARLCSSNPVSLSHKDYDADVCSLQSSFRSPYVKAYLTDAATSLSCNYSGGVTSSPLHRKEIHVIFVQVPSNNSTASEKHKRIPQIVLKIIPNNNSMLKNLELVFVLASNQTVKWKILSDCIKSTHHNLFWVSTNSQILQDTGFSQDQIRTFEPQSDAKLLRRWVNATIGRITSMKKRYKSRRITTAIGLDSMSERACRSNKELTPKETKGCVILSNENSNKDVHIIEIEKHVDQPSTIFLNIYPQSKGLRRRHLLLVLKSHVRTQWMVRTWRLRGMLDIVTDQTVDTKSVEMQSVRVVNEPLTMMSGLSLIQWTANNYEAPVSYTSATLANRFNLTVDGDKRFYPIRNDIVQNLLVRLKESLSVKCLPDNMHISLIKSSLQDFKHRLSNVKLSLVDPTCIAYENGTHYLWSTSSVAACGSVRRERGSRVTIENAIIFRPLKKKSSSAEDFSGSGMKSTDDDDFDETLSDDEDVIRISPTVKFDFNCTYNSATNSVTDLHLDPDFYYLRLFKDVNFQHEIISFPVTVGDRQRLFLEAGLHSHEDDGLKVVVTNCSISSKQRPDFPPHNLLVNGCILDATVIWRNGNEFEGDFVSSERFEFVFHEFWDERTTSYLSCRLSICSKRLHQTAGIPQCRTRSDGNCLNNQGYHSSLTTRENVPTVTKNLGPLVLHLVNGSSGKSSQVVTSGSLEALEEQEERQQSESLSSCNQIVHVEGLDSVTVVGIAFAAFVIGILLSGTLWYIHSHTGPGKKHALRHRSVETSGESTPSSTIPITICQTNNHA